MEKEEIEKRLELLRINKEGYELSLKECVSSLSKEGLEKLYNLYYIDFLGERKNSKQAKVNYLVREIPSQFLDYMRYMINADTKDIIEKLCNKKDVDKNIGLVELAEYGFIYISKSGKVIIPLDLKYFIMDLFC